MLLSSLFEMLIEYVTVCPFTACGTLRLRFTRDRKSTRLNSSHITISYAVFCLKKKKRPHTPRKAAGLPVWIHADRRRRRASHRGHHRLGPVLPRTHPDRNPLRRVQDPTPRAHL